MEDLFKKYLYNECSPEEVRELLCYFNITENESLLRSLINESLRNIDPDEDVSQWKPFTDEVFTAIKKKIQPERGKLVFIKKIWIQRAAAAVLLLVGGFAVFISINKTNKKEEIVKIDAPKNEIGPGSNKAILTLADGSTILLDSAVIGELAQQGDTKIVKLAVGQLAYNAPDKRSSEVLLNQLTTPRGGQYEVTLSDGSKIWLNAASTLRFPAKFIGAERKVELSGEAYFEVAKNAARPFKVKVEGKGEVEVLGTHFNMNAFIDEATVNTTLLEGKVKVTVSGTGHSRILNPGDQAQLNSNGKISLTKNVDTGQVVSWKNGAFNFSNADVAAMFREISRWYNVDVLFEGQIPQRHFNGEIQRKLNLSQVLKLLEKNGVFCKLEGRRLIVKGNVVTLVTHEDR